MFKNYLKIALRSLVKYKIHSLTNVLGFAAALSVVILLSLYVNNEMSADKFHKNYKNIYRLQTIDGVALAPQYADILRESFPEIKKVTRINHVYSQVVLNYKHPVSVGNILFVDKTFFEIFSYETTDGSLAIVIACLGLFGLVSFMTEQRTKEIGVRKVLGCTVSGIVVLLSKDFCRWVLISNVIAWPLAYHAMTKWLQYFAYRIDIGLWVFVLAGVDWLYLSLSQR